MGSSGESQLKTYVVQQWRRDVERVRQYVDTLAGDLTEAELNWQAGPGLHSMWHHIWHMFLVFDHYFAGAFGIRPAWEEGDWRSRIELVGMAKAFTQEGFANEFIPRFTICKVQDSLVDELRAPPLKQYLAYVDDMLGRCTAVLERASEPELAREITVNGKPRRATDFAHPYRHIGMMEDLRGLIRGAGKGSASS